MSSVGINRIRCPISPKQTKGLSPVDAHLLGSVLLSPGTRLWTRDKHLKASATQIGAVTVDWH